MRSKEVQVCFISSSVLLLYKMYKIFGFVLEISRIRGRFKAHNNNVCICISVTSLLVNSVLDHSLGDIRLQLCEVPLSQA